jgi:hypothetical protein
MNATEKVRDFESRLGSLIAEHLEKQTPIRNMLLALTDEEFQLRCTLQTRRMMELHQKTANHILEVPLDLKGMKLPPPPGGAN